MPFIKDSHEHMEEHKIFFTVNKINVECPICYDIVSEKTAVKLTNC